MSENVSGSNTFPLIQGVDTVKGIAMTGGTADSYRQVLSMFCKDARERLQKFRFFLFEGMSNGSGEFPEKHIASFTTQVQALKTASATIGAAEISAEAAGLEAAGKGRDLAFLQDRLPGFVEQLAQLVENVRAVIESGQDIEGAESPSAETQKADSYLSMFNELSAALKSRKVTDIDKILEELSCAALDSKTRKILEQISDQVLMAEFAGAIKTIAEFVGATK